ncbi:VOC family protein [Nocardia sp. 2]|uniref:VOC family protein n=1 Tax=Nocardia acididurans TaxID=2802282 RepID=A0ABS1MK32_9NOCA|nr:VOC family protein [Nocardia acididurans]MBL1079613.1 VOC family protein [Nocardia acididurans]
MITGLNTAIAWVLDQDSAKKFYTDTLGLDARVDVPFGEGVRWVTVGAPNQPDVQVTLMVPGPPVMDAESAEQLKSLIAKGVLTSCTFTVTDCQADYTALAARGVTFVQPPTQRPWGLSAILLDDSGCGVELLQPAY